MNVRVIASTSAHIEHLVQEGSFRADLYYRFGVFVIDMPPLRARAEDVPLLVKQFLGRMAGQIGQEITVAPEAMALLTEYTWPGNVRELESLLERLVTVDGRRHIRPQDLPHTIRLRHSPVLGKSPLAAEPVLSLAEMEREAIMRAGWAYRGHVTRMAEHLGISRTTLWRKMKEMGISPKMFKTETQEDGQ
ncbi:MAG: helix-turn-helix domain-containing protein [Ardenticatenia bacterium]|nr:helix-turn-helix domain-containing protein [Ardenticatenia bacterium]